MKTAKLFQYGQHQAVALPEEFQFEGSEVYVKRVGDAVVLMPTRTEENSDGRRPFPLTINN